MTRRIALVTAVVVAAALSPTVHAYLKLGANVAGGVVALHWAQQPVHYYVKNRDVSGVTAPQLQTALASAFGTWAGVTTAAVGAQFDGFVTADPFVDDGMTVIGFRRRLDLDHTLGATTFTMDTVTGAIVESDIFLNSAFNWSVSGNGDPTRYDVQSIATHEIGHLFGLSHSALGETDLNGAGQRHVIGKGSVMFPIAFPAGNLLDRTLQPDDVAGISDLYGTAAFDRNTGSISGRVVLNGAGIFGAHVIAFNPASGASIGTFTLTPQGNFVLAGLAAGVYVVRAEPLDDADSESFFDGTTDVNLNFRVGYASKLVAVPAGGSGGTIQITVQPK